MKCSPFGPIRSPTIALPCAWCLHASLLASLTPLSAPDPLNILLPLGPSTVWPEQGGRWIDIEDELGKLPIPALACLWWFSGVAFQSCDGSSLEARSAKRARNWGTIVGSLCSDIKEPVSLGEDKPLVLLAPEFPAVRAGINGKALFDIVEFPLVVDEVAAATGDETLVARLVSMSLLIPLPPSAPPSVGGWLIKLKETERGCVGMGEAGLNVNFVAGETRTTKAMWVNIWTQRQDILSTWTRETVKAMHLDECTLLLSLIGEAGNQKGKQLVLIWWLKKEAWYDGREIDYMRGAYWVLKCATYRTKPKPLLKPVTRSCKTFADLQLRKGRMKIGVLWMGLDTQHWWSMSYNPQVLSKPQEWIPEECQQIRIGNFGGKISDKNRELGFFLRCNIDRPMVDGRTIRSRRVLGGPFKHCPSALRGKLRGICPLKVERPCRVGHQERSRGRILGIDRDEYPGGVCCARESDKTVPGVVRSRSDLGRGWWDLNSDSVGGCRRTIPTHQANDLFNVFAIHPTFEIAHIKGLDIWIRWWLQRREDGRWLLVYSWLKCYRGSVAFPFDLVSPGRQPARPCRRGHLIFL